jgi:hypothetical protein
MSKLRGREEGERGKDGESRSGEWGVGELVIACKVLGERDRKSVV